MMRANYWKEQVEGLLDQIEDLISELPDKGDTCEESQKVCLRVALSEMYANVSGVEDEDFVELNDEEE